MTVVRDNKRDINMNNVSLIHPVYVADPDVGSQDLWSFLNLLCYPQKVVVFMGALPRLFTFSSGLLLPGSLHHFAK